MESVICEVCEGEFEPDVRYAKCPHGVIGVDPEPEPDDPGVLVPEKNPTSKGDSASQPGPTALTQAQSEVPDA